MPYMIRLCFLLCAALVFDRTTAGGAGNITTDADGFAEAWVKGPDGRGTWEIIYSSGLTLFLASWVSLHFNIPSDAENWTSNITRGLIYGLLSFIAPEAIVFFALAQWILMRHFLKELNKLHRQSQSLLGKEEQKEAAFNSRYAWYALMGGFSIDVSHLPKHNRSGKRYVNHAGKMTFNLMGILKLAEHSAFLPMSDASIKDKSKADSLAKTLVCIQVLWFLGQVLQRKIAGLPIPLLEFHTTVNIACALAMYALWWTKPRGIETATTEASSSIESLVPTLLSTVTPRQQFHTQVYSTDGCQQSRENFQLIVWRYFDTDIRNDPRYDHDDSSLKGIISIAGVGQQTLVCTVSSLKHWCSPRELEEQLRNTLDEPFVRITHYRDSLPPGTALGHLSEDLAREPTVPSSYFDRHQDLEKGVAIRKRHYSLGTTTPRDPGLWPRLPQEIKQDRGHQVVGLVQIPSESFYQSYQPIWANNFINYFWTDRTVLMGDDLDRLLQDFQGMVPNQYYWMYSAIGLVIACYAAIHVIPAVRGFNFPTSVELGMWKYSCYILISGAVGLAFPHTLIYYIHVRADLVASYVTPAWVVYLAILTAARLFIVIESFICLRKERAEIFQTPDWNWLDYIPHI